MLVLQRVKNREVLKHSENTLKPAHGASNGFNFFYSEPACYWLRYNYVIDTSNVESFIKRMWLIDNITFSTRFKS